MSRSEIPGIYQLYRRLVPYGLDVYQKIWWLLMPGTVIRVKWPSGPVTIDESMPRWDWTVGPSKYIVDSADPNDHYRPWLEANAGRQGWDWNWGMGNLDITENRLTIKFRRGREQWASVAALRWA